MSLSFNKKTLYAAERDGWSSYRVLGPREIAFQSNLTLRGRCDGADFKHGTTNVLAGQRAPYSIYGAGRSPCGNVIGSGVDGSFDHLVQNVTYKADSRIYGMAHDPSGNYIYSADPSSNGLWTHKVDPVTGLLTAAWLTAHPEAKARPRRLAVHPSGNYLYVVLSRLNKVAVYSIKRNLNAPQLVYTGKSFSLVPPGQENQRYRGSELALSANNDILYLTSRYIVKRRQEEDKDGEGADEEGETAGDDKHQPKRQSIRVSWYKGEVKARR
ncbi:hypothetical protein EG328_005591 [Venturia inaequalis]|uniref:Uncharacterized protein n=1 Tax=Venturia inaequalis TaxID=5025 RepID=A0A8H3VJG6_VENIN|nr:hypothetical protein EG328_005591 [Venturia inaequalis]